MEFRKNQFITITDSETSEYVASGVIKIITYNPDGISFDGITFYSTISSRFNFKSNILNIGICGQITDFSKYKVCKHNDIDNTMGYDIFMWNPIEPEVKPTVDLLNELPFIETFSSCSGHGKRPPYIDFEIKSLNQFFRFLEFLNKNGLKSYCSKHSELDDNKNNFRFIVGVEGRNTCHLELVDVKGEFVELNKAIKKYLLQ